MPTTAVELRANGARYEWIEEWATFPADPESQRAWPHHGLAALGADEIVTFHPGRAQLLYFNHLGTLLRTSAAPVTEAHGITLTIQDEEQRLWLADAGMHREPRQYATPIDDSQAAVIQLGSRSGSVMRALPRPPQHLYLEKPFRPTSAVGFDQRYGGNDDVWVADGYGNSLVHRFTSSGEHVVALSGEEGAGRFDGPHALFIDNRRGEAELYVADRAMARIQIYDMSGVYRRSIGEAFLSRPTSMATFDGMLFVLEYWPPRLTVLDDHDRFMGYLGADPAAADRPHWPNRMDAQGHLARPTTLTPGRFNSPHALAVDSAGSLYVTEWVIGGRTVKLQPL